MVKYLYGFYFEGVLVQIMNDIDYMLRSLELAKLGSGKVNPNPLVGSVIVKDGTIIGEGYHEIYGGPHAEVNAFNSCTESPVGATIYVTLEPCSHVGKTPPCVDKVIASGVKRVVIGSFDPNPLVAGRGIAKLEAAGITVEIGVLKAECDELNAPFFHYITNKTPYIIMKYAMTTDGKIATHTGASRWITSETARKLVHTDRGRYAGIMVGVGTIVADDPMLDCRIEGGTNPIRIICDTTLRTPISARVVTTAKQVPTFILTSNSNTETYRPYEQSGCIVLNIPEKNGHLDLEIAAAVLGERGIGSIILEGGATLNASALDAGIIQKVQAYIAPKIFGGSSAPGPVAGVGIIVPDEAYRLKNRKITVLEEDILLEYDVVSK